MRRAEPGQARDADLTRRPGEVGVDEHHSARALQLDRQLGEELVHLEDPRPTAAELPAQHSDHDRAYAVVAAQAVPDPDDEHAGEVLPAEVIPGATALDHLAA